MDLDELAALSEGRLKVLAYADVAGFDDCSLEATRLHVEHHVAPHRPDGLPLLRPHPRRLCGREIVQSSSLTTGLLLRLGHQTPRYGFERCPKPRRSPNRAFACTPAVKRSTYPVAFDLHFSSR